MARLVLTDLRTPLYNYDFVRNHIEAGQALDIAGWEMTLLRSAVEYCAHWKSLARKLLKSRSMAILVAQAPLEEEKGGPEADEEKKRAGRKALYFDNQQYCICRRGDDGMVFMIECESCKEWFHGECVGVCKQLAARINQYFCIGCARLVFDFEPGKPYQALKDEKNPTPTFYLDAFTARKRASYKVLLQLIKDAETFAPIFLEELRELRAAREQIKAWKSKVDDLRPIPPFYLGEEEEAPEQRRNGFDYTTNYLLKLYLESEAFPVRLDDAEFVVGLMKQRKWLVEASRVLEAGAGKNSKAQQKKTVKLLTQASELRVDREPKLSKVLDKLENHHRELHNQTMSSKVAAVEKPTSYQENNYLKQWRAS